MTRPARDWDDLVSQAERVHALVVESGVTPEGNPETLDPVALREAVAELEAMIAQQTRVPKGGGGERPQTPAELLKKLLDAHGLGNRVGGLRVHDEERPVQALKSVPHERGLPAYLLCVAPDYVPLDGAHGLFVSVRGVFSAIIARPWEHATWRIQHSASWSSPDELVELLRRFSRKPVGGRS